jgi:hypothetical protein
MASLEEFARRVRIYGRNVDKNIGRVVREVALVVDRELVLATPVDTGRARSNWIVNLGSAATGSRDPYTPGEKGSTGEANAQAAIAQGNATIGLRKDGQDIYISNNLPYIGRLNEGSSAQAPAQFVEQAVQRAVQVVRKARVVSNGN